MELEEVFESRPRKAVSFVVERDKEVQEWREQKMPKALPGYNGGKLPGRSTAEGREEQWTGMKRMSGRKNERKLRRWQRV